MILIECIRSVGTTSAIYPPHSLHYYQREFGRTISWYESIERMLCADYAKARIPIVFHLTRKFPPLITSQSHVRVFFRTWCGIGFLQNFSSHIPFFFNILLYFRITSEANTHPFSQAQMAWRRRKTPHYIIHSLVVLASQFKLLVRVMGTSSFDMFDLSLVVFCRFVKVLQKYHTYKYTWCRQSTTHKCSCKVLFKL